MRALLQKAIIFIVALYKFLLLPLLYYNTKNKRIPIKQILLCQFSVAETKCFVD